MIQRILIIKDFERGFHWLDQVPIGERWYDADLVIGLTNDDHGAAVLLHHKELDVGEVSFKVIEPTPVRP